MFPLSIDDLWRAWERVRENEGCAGADGVTIHTYAQRVQRYLPALLSHAQAAQYPPYPLLKIVVEKHPGSAERRTLLVPAVRDRVLQTAMAHHLSRSFEEEFLECSYGYRPGRSVDRAIARIRKCRELGYAFAADGDIDSFFDRVDHDLLLRRLAERNLGEPSMALLRQWVRCQQWDGSHVRAVRRDSCISIRATRPIASGSGRRARRSLPSLIASPERSERVNDPPDEAEYPSLNTR